MACFVFILLTVVPARHQSCLERLKVLEEVDSAMTIPVSVLHASTDDERRAALGDILRRTKWSLYQAGSYEEMTHLLTRHQITVIVSELEFCDREWEDLFDEVGSEADAPRFVVCCPSGNLRAWAEALNLGARDVLAIPFEANEVYFVIRNAHLSWLSSRTVSGPPVARRA